MPLVRTGETLTSDPVYGRLEHLAVAEVERDVLAAAGAVEDDVAAAHLRRRDLAAHVVLRTRVVRQLDADAGERVQDQPGAVESDCARTGVDALARARPRCRHPTSTARPSATSPRRITYSEACLP